MTSPQLLTSSQAAQIVGCKPVTIRQNVARGKLSPAMTVGKTHLFRISDIKRFASHYTGKK